MPPRESWNRILISGTGSPSRSTWPWLEKPATIYFGFFGSLTHRQGSRLETRTNDLHGVRSVVPSARVLPGPPQDTPSLLSPRGDDGGISKLFREQGLSIR